ncbi:hypothetical protein [Mucilaginibacter sp. SP1R1]|uniref:hypothetical protein n=1 Tax=Mucilaginibacter sp. SP1R1 TaxID=2723091 RepID=UPI00161E69CE|nr:hypothetical protein [Mucilaginibacter sp. SP1R1]MBB6150203.1 putative membrane protein YphA (DoxX/SURF4 family) [Mucilaginibacter sp. SP1R1]
MKNNNKLWQVFFAVSLIAIAVQQLVCGGFRPVIMPPWSAGLSGNMTLVWVISLLLILAAVAIIFDIKAREVAFYLGVVLLLLLLAFHIPYGIKNNLHFFAGWSDAFKILAFSGGAFIVASSLPATPGVGANPLEKIIPAGRFFFAITMIAFGAEHFIYAPFVEMLVPGWMPGHIFWTYFAGVALIAAGGAIVLHVQLRLAANLLGIMIFLWLIMLHIPRAIADPHSGNGNEWTSVFEALGFSGTAFLLAAVSRQKG